jgi:hypothetical protein
MVVGIGVLASSAVVSAWGGVAYLRRIPSITFWPLLRVGQAFVAIEALLGVGLFASGDRAPDDLHPLYGVACLAVAVISEGMRLGAAQKELEDVVDIEALEHREKVLVARRVALAEMGVMTIGMLLILTLALRAYQTGY